MIEYFGYAYLYYRQEETQGCYQLQLLWSHTYLNAYKAIHCPVHVGQVYYQHRKAVSDE